MTRTFFERIQFRFYTWHFSNRVMVTYNCLSDVIFVLILALYASTAASSYRWTFFDSAIFFLFLLVTLSKVYLPVLIYNYYNEVLIKPVL